MIVQILIINIYMVLNVLIIAQREPLIIIIYVKIVMKIVIYALINIVMIVQIV